MHIKPLLLRVPLTYTLPNYAKKTLEHFNYTAVIPTTIHTNSTNTDIYFFREMKHPFLQKKIPEFVRRQIIPDKCQETVRLYHCIHLYPYFTIL